MTRSFLSLVMAVLASGFITSQALSLVDEATITAQKRQTQNLQLKTKVPLLYRQIEGAAISGLTLSFPFGSRHLPQDQRGKLALVLEVMTKGTKGYNKAKLLALLEKYSASISCSQGVELSSCSLVVDNDYWAELLPAFAEVIHKPSFEAKAIELERQAMLAQYAAMVERPGAFINQVVNRVFYPETHPYRLDLKLRESQVAAAKPAELRQIHGQILARDGLFFTYVGALSSKQVLKDLNKRFGTLQPKALPVSAVPKPRFALKDSIAFEAKEIPTAYINLKFNGPGHQDPDYQATRFMMRILSQELALEVRTRQSLSYAIHAFLIGKEIGIGVISVTTSKPQETLAAISKVIERLRDEPLDTKEVELHKTVYTTQYFLTLEGHLDLAGALATSFYRYGSTDRFYELPRRLESVDAKQVHGMAQKYLKDFRVGVIHSEKAFKRKEYQSFIKTHMAER